MCANYVGRAFGAGATPPDVPAARVGERWMAREQDKFTEFDARLRQARGQGEREPEGGVRAEQPKSGASGVQAGIELFAGVVGGGLIGYFLDRWLETWPVLFIVMFFLGAAAGMLNAYRHIRRASEAPPER